MSDPETIVREPYTLRFQWRIGSGGIEFSSDGTTIYHDAVLIWNEQEQIRDIRVNDDGSIVIGPEKVREAVRTAGEAVG